MPRTLTTPENREVLASHVKNRRHALGLNNRLSGMMAESTLAKIEAGGYTSRLNGTTMSKLDDALGWTSGSAAGLLDGSLEAPALLPPPDLPVAHAVEIDYQGASAFGVETVRYHGASEIRGLADFAFVYGPDGPLGGVRASLICAIRFTGPNFILSGVNFTTTSDGEAA